MADEVNVKFTADSSGLVTAKTGFRDVVSEMEQFEAQSNSLTSATKDVSEGLKGVSLQTAGATREFIVLGHEVINGNFSRIPGSLLVLASRLGGLSTSFLAVGAAAGVAAAAIYEVAKSAQEAEQFQGQLSTALSTTGKAIDQASLNQTVESLSRLAGVSEDTAREIILSFTRAHNIGGDLIIQLSKLTDDYAAVTGQKLPEAAASLAKAFEDPAKGAIELQKVFDDQLDPAVINNIINLQKLGYTASAQQELFDQISQHAEGAAQRGLSTFQKANNSIYNAAVNLIGKLGDLKERFLELAGLASEKQDNSEQKAADTEAKADAAAKNKMLGDALSISRELQGVEGQRAKINAQITQLQQGQKLAANKGDVESYNQITTAIKNAETELAKLNKPDTSASAQYLADQRQMYQEGYQIKSSYAQLAFESGKTTKQQEVAAEKAALQEEFAAENANLGKVVALYAKGTKEWQKALDQRKLAQQKFDLEIVKLDQQAEKQKEQIQKKSEEKIKSSLTEIQNAFNQQATLIITGQEKIGQGFIKLAGTLVTSLIQAFLEIGEQWVATQLLELITGEATTDAIIAGHAGEAYSAAYASTAAIPIIGPFIAPGVAAAAGTAAEVGGLALASFDVGTNYVPSDGVAMIHEGERIIPKADNTKLNDALENGGGRGETHAHFHFHTLDSQGVAAMVKRNASALSKGIGGAARGGNGALRSAAAKL